MVKSFMCNIFIIMVVASASLFSAVALEGDANADNAEKESSRQNVLKVGDDQQGVEQDKKPCGSLVGVAQKGDPEEERAAETHRLCQEIVQKLGVMKLEDEPIENKSFPFNAQFKSCRDALLQARAVYFRFYSENSAIEQSRRLQGSLMGVLRLLASGEFNSNLGIVTMLHDRKVEIEKMTLSLHKQHPGVRCTFGCLESEYTYALDAFAYECAAQAGLDRKAVVASVRSRDIVCGDGEALCDYAEQEIDRWREKLRPNVIYDLTCMRSD